MAGERRSTSKTGSTTIGYQAIMGASDSALPDLPEKGITLLECLQYMPSMHSFIQSHNMASYILRAKATLITKENPLTNTFNLVVHPYHGDVLKLLYSNIKVHPSNIYDITITELDSGLIIQFTQTKDNPIKISFSPCSMWSKEEIRFFASPHPLNEFGLFYVALYIAGNYARYYPDRWLADVDRATPLALAVEELIAQAEQRVPLLALSELSRNYFVPE
jgi:hypothetical protein